MVGLLVAAGTAGYLLAASLWDASEARFLAESSTGAPAERTDSESLR